MADFGVTKEGFRIKPFDTILNETLDRMRQMFGDDVDLTATSPLNKIAQVTVAAGPAECWKWMEDLYYSNFISTAIGDNLDLLGEDLGLARRNLFAQGEVTFTIHDAAPGRTYTLPEGTVVVTAAPEKSFYTTAPVSLSANAQEERITVRAYDRGPDGDITAGEIVGIALAYQQIYLRLGLAAIEAANDVRFSGGAEEESDEVYRARLLGLPRNRWTLESVRRAALDVDGVIDVLLFDPLGGVDVSQSYFNLFNFGERLFSSERRLGEPYFFDIIVAHEFAWPWRTQGLVLGVHERVRAAVDRVRPIGIHPNIIQANHIEVGVRATVVVERGYDAQSLLASIKARIAADIGLLKLGGDVLYSQVMRAFAEQPGVVDVQNMRLRRCPPAMGRITFGTVPFQSAAVEAAAGENLVMGPTEIAIFRLDSDLIDIEVTTR